MVLSKKLGGLQPKEEIPSVSKKSKAGSQGFVSGFTFDQEMVGIVVYGCMIFGYISSKSTIPNIQPVSYTDI